MAKPKRKQGLVVALGSFAGVVVLLVLALFLPRAETPPAPDKAFDYNLEGLQRVPAAVRSHVLVRSNRLALAQPHALVLDKQDQVYISGKAALLVLDSSGRRVRLFALPEPGLCLAVDRNSLYVGFKEYVARFSLQGKFLQRFPHIGEQARLTSLAVSGAQILAADYGHKRVWRYNRQGNLLGYVDGTLGGSRRPGFLLPSPCFDLAAAGNEFWVVNTGRRLVERYNANGKRLAAWGKTSLELDGFSGCCNPVQIALHPAGGFVTAEKGVLQVKRFDAQGRFLGVVAAADQFTRNSSGFDLGVDSRGRIHVLDSGRAWLLLFGPRPGKEGARS